MKKKAQKGLKRQGQKREQKGGASLKKGQFGYSAGTLKYLK